MAIYSTLIGHLTIVLYTSLQQLTTKQQNVFKCVNEESMVHLNHAFTMEHMVNFFFFRRIFM